MTIMTSSKAFVNNASPAELFADSFDSWIEPNAAMPQNQSLENSSPVFAPNSMKWVAWTETPADWLSENAEVFKPSLPRSAALSGERLLRGVAWAVGGLVGLIIASLLLFSWARGHKPVAVKGALPKIATPKRVAPPKTKSQNIISRANTPLVRHASIAPRKLQRATSARITRQRASEKQALILGRGPVREDTRSIIFIRD